MQFKWTPVHEGTPRPGILCLVTICMDVAHESMPQVMGAIPQYIASTNYKWTGTEWDLSDSGLDEDIWPYYSDVVAWIEMCDVPVYRPEAAEREPLSN
jgi:hypothetical protein